MLVHLQLWCIMRPVKQETHTRSILSQRRSFICASASYSWICSVSPFLIYPPSYLFSSLFIFSSLVSHCLLPKVIQVSIHTCVFVCVCEWSLALCCGNEKQVLSWYQMSYQCFIADISLVIPAWCVQKLLDELKRMILLSTRHTHTHLFSYHGWGFIWTFCPLNPYKPCCIRTFSLFTLPVKGLNHYDS